MNSMKGPYSTISPCRLRNSKAGDKTMNVYNGDGEVICVVPRVTHNRFRTRQESEAIAEVIARMLNRQSVTSIPEGKEQMTEQEIEKAREKRQDCFNHNKSECMNYTPKGTEIEGSMCIWPWCDYCSFWCPARKDS